MHGDREGRAKMSLSRDLFPGSRSLSQLFEKAQPIMATSINAIKTVTKFINIVYFRICPTHPLRGYYPYATAIVKIKASE